MSNALAKFFEENSDKTQKWLANEIGVKPPSVHEWTKKGVPLGRVKDVSELTGIPRSELAPELFG